ncbi:MAG: hypothetical protein M3Q07_22905 [Pseudobdellovibrionaceae bacterium]|nr:hypothetical protein [Pseudobdellovibrionaceae bacterium]
MKTLDRRNFLMNSLGALGALSLGPGLTSMVSAQPFLDYHYSAEFFMGAATCRLLLGSAWTLTSF